LNAKSSTLSLDEARRIALTAQRLDGSAAKKSTSISTIIDQLGLLQIDSVNVIARAHYLPLFSRLGAYPQTALEKKHGGRTRIYLNIGAMKPVYYRSPCTR
jgi:uncharacterized protein